MFRPARRSGSMLPIQEIACSRDLSDGDGVAVAAALSRTIWTRLVLYAALSKQAGTYRRRDNARAGPPVLHSNPRGRRALPRAYPMKEHVHRRSNRPPGRERSRRDCSTRRQRRCPPVVREQVRCDVANHVRDHRAGLVAVNGSARRVSCIAGPLPRLLSTCVLERRRWRGGRRAAG